jgi:hypothetical protein
VRLVHRELHQKPVPHVVRYCGHLSSHFLVPTSRAGTLQLDAGPNPHPVAWLEENTETQNTTHVGKTGRATATTLLSTVLLQDYVLKQIL